VLSPLQRQTRIYDSLAQVPCTSISLHSPSLVDRRPRRLYPPSVQMRHDGYLIPSYNSIIHRVPKNQAPKLLAVTLSNLDGF